VTTVLLAEYDPTLAEPLARALAREGYDVQVSPPHESAEERVNGSDLLVLDLSVAAEEGQQTISLLRGKGIKIPVLVLTSRTDQIDKLSGFEKGRDDYVTKPFRLVELLARVRELTRPGRLSSADDEITAQDVSINTKTRTAHQGENELHLTAKEFDLLAALVAAAGTAVPRETLTQRVWGNDPGGSTKTLDTHITWLQRKLSDGTDNFRYISQEPEVGFRFELEAS
jgi:DNA-binding response OmpR family regulator